MDLAWLLHPTDLVAFKRDYWERKPLVSLGVLPITWASVVLNVVQSAIDGNPVFRQSLPPGFASDEGFDGENATRLAELMTDLVQGIDPARAIDEARAAAWRGRQPSLAGHLLDLEAAPRLGLDTRLRCRKGTGVSVSRTDETVCVFFHSKRVEFPLYVDEDIRFITEAGEFAPSELPGNLDANSRLVLVSPLMVEGLLTTTHRR